MNIISPETVDNLRQDVLQNFYEIIYKELNKALLIFHTMSIKIPDTSGLSYFHGIINLSFVTKQIKSKLVECGFKVEKFDLYCVERDLYMDFVIKTQKDMICRFYCDHCRNNLNDCEYTNMFNIGNLTLCHVCFYDSYTCFGGTIEKKNLF